MNKKLILALVISALATILILKATTTELTWQAIKNADPFYILLAFLMQVLFWILWAFRLKTIARSLGYKVPFFYTLEVTMVGMLTAAITPSSAGGEPVRAKMLNDRGVSAGESAFIVLVERFLDAVFFATALPFFVLLTGYGIFGLRVAAVFLISLIIFIFILYLIFKDDRNMIWIAKIFRKKKDKIIMELINFRQAALKLKEKKKDLAFFLFITAFMWSFGFTIPSFILLSLGSDHFLLYSYTAQLIIVVISLIPLTPGSSGLAEFSMAYLYSKFVSSELLGILVATWRVVTYHSNILAGTIVLNLHLKKRLKVLVTNLDRR
ncbi:MAG: flippase-like domain-containing protein [Archaeoglobaceae archaeon]|nr:flippase-like domain-containing protein [Archaeoglobaceae archaeon]MCX8152159.1 flippase-like domain-containing protein [Archaeoglobaceae archaeon]MDW8013875.1 flippase-like domain-containing protein [Archaeoglobaceae archaeon]